MIIVGIFSYIDDPSRFQIHQARAEEITLKEDFISVPMPLDDDFGNIFDFIFSSIVLFL
jgi:hypothetical protein